MSFPSADYDKWKQTLPEETEEEYVESARFSEGFKPYDPTKLDARLRRFDLDSLTPNLIVDIVDQWLLDIETGWRTSFETKALEFAETLANLRKNSLRN